MPQAVEPLREEWIPPLSEFLKEGFCQPGEYCDFTDPDVLLWQFFQKRGPWEVPRSFVARQNDKIAAHVGLATTEFLSIGRAQPPVPAVHMIAWLSRAEGGSLGT